MKENEDHEVGDEDDVQAVPAGGVSDQFSQRAEQFPMGRHHHKEFAAQIHNYGDKIQPSEEFGPKPRDHFFHHIHISFSCFSELQCKLQVPWENFCRAEFVSDSSL